MTLIYVVAISGFLGLGIFLSALTLIFTKTASFESIISYALLLVSGVIIPIESLPPALYKTVTLFPYFYEINMAQKICFTGSCPPLQWLVLILLNFLMLALGLSFYNICLSYVRHRGLINKY